MSRRRKQQPRTRPRGAPPRNAGTVAGAKPAPAPAPDRRSQRRPQSARRKPRPGRRRWWPKRGIAVVVAVVAGVVVAVLLAIQSPPASSSASAGQVLAPISTSVTGQPVDGIQCQAGEQLVFHIHAHLAVYVNGSARTIPQGIGIMPPRTEQSTDAGPVVTAGSCFYWLHAHTDDGIIHIESPVQRTFTLGNYFDVWGVPLDNSQVGPASGTVIAYLNGQRYTGDVRAIPLSAHNLVQLDVSADVAPAPFSVPFGD